MFGRSSKRRKVEPATKQSKLYQFFQKPVEKTENFLSQVSSQKSRSNRPESDNFNSERNEIRPVLPPQSGRKADTFDRYDSCNITHEIDKAFLKRPILRNIGNSSHVVKLTHEKTSNPNEDSFFSMDDCKFRRQSIEVLSDTAVCTNLRSPPADLPTKSTDFQSLTSSTNNSMTIAHSPVTSPVNFLTDPAEQSLNSNDVNTLPFSAVISKPTVAQGIRVGSESSGVHYKEMSPVVSSVELETQEEMNTNDVNTVPFSFVISKPQTKTSKSTPKKNESPNEETLSELNTLDVSTLPNSFVIGNAKKLKDTTPSYGINSLQLETKEDVSITNYEEIQVSAKKFKSSITSSLPDSEYYMERVWAIFEPDSDVEQEKDPTTNSVDEGNVRPDKPCGSSSANTNVPSDHEVTTSKEHQVSQLEELNSADVMTVPYSPVIGEALSKTCPPEERLEIECFNSDSVDTVYEDDGFVGEDSLTLENFTGMRGPDSFFTGDGS